MCRRYLLFDHVVDDKHLPLEIVSWTSLLNLAGCAKIAFEVIIFVRFVRIYTPPRQYLKVLLPHLLQRIITHSQNTFAAFTAELLTLFHDFIRFELFSGDLNCEEQRVVD